MVENEALDSWDGREGHTSTLVGNALYVFGGVNDESGFENKNDLLKINVRPEIVSGKFLWSIVTRGTSSSSSSSSPTARKGHVAGLLSSRFFVIFGGFDSENAHQDDVWVYDHGKNGLLGGEGGCSTFLSSSSSSSSSSSLSMSTMNEDEEKEGTASEVMTALKRTCHWYKPSTLPKTAGGLVGSGPFARQGHSAAVLGERTAPIGASEMIIFGGHDDELQTYYNDAW